MILQLSFATYHSIPHHELQHSRTTTFNPSIIPSNIHSFFPITIKHSHTHTLTLTLTQDSLCLSKIHLFRYPVRILISLSLMAAVRPLLMLLLIFMASPSLMLAISTAINDQPQLPTSTIAAAPALLPDSPLASSPALSPDITPLFPSPGGSELSPSDSSMPTIPSSLSPPNPDATGAPGPAVAFSPVGSLPLSSSNLLKVPGLLSSAVLIPALLAFW